MEPLPEETELDGVVVRRWVPADASALHDAVLANVEHLRPWMAWIRFEPMTVPERCSLIAEWEQAWRDGGDIVLGIWRDGQVVGGCGLHRRVGPGGLEIGYWVHVDHIGQGIATTAARAVTDLAFTAADIDRVEIHHDVANETSSRIPEKLGYLVIDDVASPRDEAAPAETGIDRVWRTTRSQWLAG